MAIPAMLKMVIGLEIRCEWDWLKNIFRAINDAIFILAIQTHYYVQSYRYNLKLKSLKILLPLIDTLQKLNVRVFLDLKFIH